MILSVAVMGHYGRREEVDLVVSVDRARFQDAHIEELVQAGWRDIKAHDGHVCRGIQRIWGHSAACEDYRAAATVDLEHDRADDEIFSRVAVPMLVLWGGRGAVGRQFDVLSCWREKSDATVDGKVIDCGHFLPEEAPTETLTEFQRFLS